MTLIELLVVIVILGVLGITVLPALSGNRENQTNRVAVQQLSSLLNQSRNDAIAVGRLGGVTVLEGGLDFARCRVPPPYRGQDVTTKATFTDPASGVTVSPAEDLDDFGVAVGDLIRFRGGRPDYSIASISPSAFTIALLSPASTTPWPPTGIAMEFEIERQPRIVGSLISLADQAAVDVSWSGYGPTSGYTRFAANAEVSIVFDKAGVLRTLVINRVRTIPDGTVFLLIGRVDRRDGGYNASAGPSASDDTIGANWQYPTSYWVGIDPASGQTRIAECVPGSATVVDSQDWVRAALVTQGL